MDPIPLPPSFLDFTTDHSRLVDYLIDSMGIPSRLLRPPETTPMPNESKIKLTGDATDDAVALSRLTEVLFKQLKRLNDKLQVYDQMNVNLMFILEAVVDGDMEPQQALAIIEKRKMVGK